MSVEKRISVKNKIFHTQEWRIIMRIGIRAHDVAYAPLDDLGAGFIYRREWINLSNTWLNVSAAS